MTSSEQPAIRSASPATLPLYTLSLKITAASSVVYMGFVYVSMDAMAGLYTSSRCCR